MVTIGFLWVAYMAIVALAEDRIKITETCENKFCPVGTFCDIREITSCVKPPCRPIAMCLPDNINGCKGHPKCPAGQVCVEHRTSCINRSCKKDAKCAPEGTCEALECPPSQHCVADPKPKCVKN